MKGWEKRDVQQEKANGAAECDRNQLGEMWKGKSLAGKEGLKKEKTEKNI